MLTKLCIGPIAMATLCLACDARATLIHEWNFDNGAATDSVGSADLSLAGAASIANGQLVLPGGGHQSSYAFADGAALDELTGSLTSGQTLSMVFEYTQQSEVDRANLFMAGDTQRRYNLEYTPYRSDANGPQSMGIRETSAFNYVNAEAPRVGLGVPLTAVAIWNTADNEMVLWSAQQGTPESAATVARSMSGRRLTSLQIEHFFLGANLEGFSQDAYHGAIDRVRVYDHALDQGEIDALLGITTPPEPLNPVVWDGTTDNNWTNGPQNDFNGSYPANGDIGANWTISNVPGQIPQPVEGKPRDLLNYEYAGYNWQIDGATIHDFAHLELSGGSLDVTGSTITLAPTAIYTDQIFSALNIGVGDVPTQARLVDSTLNLSRSAGNNGYSMRLFCMSEFVLENSTINASAETGLGDIEAADQSFLDLTNGSIVNATGDLDIRNWAAVRVGAGSSLDVAAVELLNSGVHFIIDGGTVEAGWIRSNSNTNTVLNLTIEISSGQVTLTDPNPLRDASGGFEGQFNWVGLPGDATITHTDASESSNLASKVADGFFSIDGVQIISGVDPNTTPLIVFNLDLFAKQIDQKYFVVTETNGGQVLSLARAVRGDTDADGDVDDTDLGNAISNFTGPAGASEGVLTGDTDGDGDVDDTDLGVGISNFTGPLTLASVPEPGPLVLAVGAGVFVLRRSRWVHGGMP